MRVIGGSLRGKKLIAPADDLVRPTTDRVKESMFNLIYEYIGEDTVVYDVFSGTGGLGIEALSRGAAKAFFCDRSSESYRLTKANIKECRLEDKCVVVFGDYKKAMRSFNEKADLVLMDPPYGLNLWKKCADELILQEKLEEDAIIVMEHGVDNELEDTNPFLSLVKERRYGAIIISIYRYSTLSEDI